MRASILAAIVASLGIPAIAQITAPATPRARELGLSSLLGGHPGTLDAITDVAGIEVGHTTLIAGDGRPQVGKGVLTVNIRRRDLHP